MISKKFRGEIIYVNAFMYSLLKCSHDINSEHPKVPYKKNPFRGQIEFGAPITFSHLKPNNNNVSE